jgi:hypothetical protein
MAPAIPAGMAMFEKTNPNEILFFKIPMNSAPTRKMAVETRLV